MVVTDFGLNIYSHLLDLIFGKFDVVFDMFDLIFDLFFVDLLPI